MPLCSLRSALCTCSEAKHNNDHTTIGKKLHALIETFLARFLCAAFDTELVADVGFATTKKLPLPCAPALSAGCCHGFPSDSDWRRGGDGGDVLRRGLGVGCRDGRFFFESGRGKGLSICRRRQDEVPG